MYVYNICLGYLVTGSPSRGTSDQRSAEHSRVNMQRQGERQADERRQKLKGRKQYDTIYRHGIEDSNWTDYYKELKSWLGCIVQ